MEKDCKKNECCDNCGQMRLLDVYVQGRDTHSLSFNGLEYLGYMREGLGIMGNYGDALEFQLCMHCGKVQGKFPKLDTDIEKAISGEEN